MQLVILTNRSDKYLPVTLEHVRSRVRGWNDLTIVDDSGDWSWRASLTCLAPDAEIVHVGPEPVGYTRAMTRVTQVMRGEFVAFWEEDFIPTSTIDLNELAETLAARSARGAGMPIRPRQQRL